MSAKMTKLDMVQDVLSDGDSDEITAISDTVEAGQIDRILRQIFFQMCANQMIPEHEELDTLETVSLVDHPGAINYLHIPDAVQRVEWVKYNRKKSGDLDDSYADLKYLDPKDFMDRISLNLSSDTNCTQVTDPKSGVQYYVRNDTAPTYWTSFDDNYIAIDSYDIGIDATQVLGTKSQVFVSTWPTWPTGDSDIPDIDDNLFPYLVAEAKATYFVNQKQQMNPKIEKQQKEQRIAIQLRKFRTRSAEEGSINATQGPSYGRRSPR